MLALNNPVLAWSAAVLLAGAALIGTSTVVHRGSRPNAAPTTSAPSVSALWPKISAHVAAKAVDASVLLPAMRAGLEAAGRQYGYRPGTGSAWNFVVRIDGTVLAVHPDPVAPVIDVDIDGDGRADAQVMRGPLLPGTSLRDVLPFVSYGDFDNQIGFAEFGSALNDRAYAAVSAALRDAQPGRQLSLLATFSHDASAALPLLMPVALLEDLQ